MKDLSDSMKVDLEKIFNSNNDNIEPEFLICSRELESEAERIASMMTKKCTVHVIDEK